MPTTFTHDVFGKDVWKLLPKQLKGIIRENEEVYRIGLHGPDIFFYYYPFMKNKTNQIGHRMHRENASEFFNRAIEAFRKEPFEPLAAYLLGFACHFVLDSTCHGYVGKFERETGTTHAEIETELDRYFMIREKKKLYDYLPAGVLNPSEENCQVIQKVFPQTSVKRIQQCIGWQKWYDKLLTCKRPVRERIIFGGMKLLGCYRSMKGQVMSRTPNPVCEESTRELVRLYQAALKEAPGVLENLYECLYGDAKLSQRFERNYN